MKLRNFVERPFATAAVCLMIVVTAAAVRGSEPVAPASAAPADGPGPNNVVELHGAIDPAVAAALDGGGHARVLVHLRANPTTIGRSSVAAVGGAGPSESDLSERRDAFEQRLIGLEATVSNLRLAGHLTDLRPLWLANAVAATVDDQGARGLSRDPSVRLVTLDESVTMEPWAPGAAAGTPNVPGVGGDPLWNIEMVGADQVWERLGIDGTGVTVGILDSGVDYHHQALQSRYRGHVGGANPSNAGNWWCKSSDYLCGPHPLYPVDGVGHGTHVIGTAVAPSGVGVAPGATWMAARVCSRADGCWLSWILEALQWMVDRDPATNPDVVNVSLSLLDSQAMREAFMALVDGGINVVAASGNDKDVVRAPAMYPEVIAVGAVTESGEMWGNSSHGYTSEGTIKPDVVAPGEFITSTLPGGSWARATGTSMASPHVAGAVALLLQAAPDLTPSEVQSILRSTAIPLTADKPHPVSGWGLLNTYGAVLSVTDSGRVEGRVFDRRDGGPIDWATVVVKTEDGAHVTSSGVDEDGRYTIDLTPGSYILQADAFTYASSVAPATVHEDTSITVDFGLDVVDDVGYYVGTVVDAATGAGLDGRIHIADVPEQFAVEFNRYSGFSQRMPPGTYHIHIAEFGYRVLVDTIQVAPGETIERDYRLTPTPKILVVDGDAWTYSASLEYYRASLRRLGYVHDEWRVTDEVAEPGDPGGPPTEDELAKYDVVIWSSTVTGPTFVQGATPVSNYLAAGGRLILSGQDALCTDASTANANDACNQKARPHPYVSEQLHLRVLSDNAKAYDVEGLDDSPLAGLSIELNGPQSMDNQSAPDVIESLSALHTRVIATYPDGRGAAAIVDTCEPHRAAALGFGFEGVSGTVTRDTLLQRLVGAVTAAPPEHGLAVMADPDELVAPAGSTSKFTVTVHNTGTSESSVDVQVVSSDWDAQLRSSDYQRPLEPPLGLKQCEARQFGVVVSVPPGAERGEVSTTRILLTDSNAGLSETVVLTTRATAPVLLVDGDFGHNTEERYEEALRQAGVPFDSWELGLLEPDPVLPTDEDLALYPIVVWFTGDDWRPDGTLNLETQAMLARYMDAGGRLYFTSEDYLSIRGGAPFDGERFFHIDYLGTDDYHADAGGAHASPMSGAGKSVLGDLEECRLQWKPPHEDFSDRLVPKNVTGKAALLNSAGLPVAVESETAAFRSLFLAFDAGELEQSCANAVMERAVDWFSPLHISRLVLEPETRLAYASGDTVRMRLDVLNGGVVDVGSVDVRWSLPEGGTLVEASVPQGWEWDPQARLLTWKGALAAGDKLQPTPDVLFQLDDDLPEHVGQVSTATIVGDSVPVVRSVEWRVNSADLRQSTKSVPDDQRLLEVGDSTTFNVNIRNTGTIPADEFVVTDTLPAALVLLRDSVSMDGGTVDLDAVPNGLVWRGSVDPGRTTAISYKARLDTYWGGWFTNEAHVADVHNGVIVLKAAVFGRPKLLLPWLGREVDPDP